MENHAGEARPDGRGPLLEDVPLRASDEDRHATVLILQDAMAKGLLTTDEGGERMAAAYAAVHLRDLGPLTVDLPTGQAKRNAPPGWRVLLMMIFEQMRSLLQDKRTGHYSRRRIGAAVFLLLLVTLLLGFAGLDGFDGGPSRGAAGFGER